MTHSLGLESGVVRLVEYDEPASSYIAPFRRAGYEHRGEQGLAGREFFRRGEPRACHLHLVEATGGA